MAAIEGKDGAFLPKIKISENSEKITNPGDKEILRIYDKDTGKIRADLITLAGERFDCDQDMTLFDPIEPWKKTRLAGGSYKMRSLLVPIFQKGECVYESPSVMEIRRICLQEKETIWDETKRFVNPAKIHVDLSDQLYALREKLLHEPRN